MAYSVLVLLLFGCLFQPVKTLIADDVFNTTGIGLRSFGVNASSDIYASGEDYLEAILMLQKKNGMVRSIDLARHMEVSKPSVSHAVKTLREGGFLTMDKDYCLHLTDIGHEVAEKIYERL